MAPPLRHQAAMKTGPGLGSLGYTMVEMAVVLMVLGILSVLSFVKLQPALEHGKVNGAASVIAADLQYGQLVAARQRKPVVVIANTATKSYSIRDRADASLVFRTRYLGTDTDYTLDAFSTTGASMEIFPTGVTRTTTTYTLGLNGYSRQVKFTKAGQVRIIKVP